MTRYTLTLVVVCASLFLGAQTPFVTYEDAPLFKCDSTTYHFGSIVEGTVIEHNFHFTNAGKTPLIIQNPWQVTGSNTIESPKEPIPPGGTGKIEVRLQTYGRIGIFEKRIVIQSNSKNGNVELLVRGNVLPDPNGPIMTFDTTTYWFDTVYQSSIIDCEFRFTNTGKSPLVISNVTGSSGSVVPSYPKEPIAPGKSGMIRVVFHTGGRMGIQDKTVTVTSNASEPYIVLHVRGYVILPPPANEVPVPGK